MTKKPASERLQCTKQFLLYLAGPITGLTYGDSTDWRSYVTKELPPHICGVSPLRAKPYLLQEISIKDAYDEFTLSSQKGITTRDRMDVMRSDMLLVNLLGAKKVSIGSVIEIAWADMLRKPIILVTERTGNVHDHAMIREMCGFIVPTLDEAIHVAISVLSPFEYSKKRP